MLDELQAVAALTTTPHAGVADVVEACRIIARALDAEDAYVIATGDPYYVRVGCDCPPGEYEIKQKGYWLVWREVATHPEFAAGMFSVAGRIAEPGRAIAPGVPVTHIVTVLPGDESNSEMLLVRGPWPDGLTAEQLAFFGVARPVVGQLVSNLLDAQRQKRQRDQLESLANISKAFSEARDADNVLDEICTSLAKASGFDWVTMSVYDDASKRVLDTAMNRARHAATETATMFREGRAMERDPNEQWPKELIGVTLLKHGGGAFVRDVFDATHDDEPEMAVARLVIPALRKYYERAHVLSVAILPIVFQDQAIGEIGFSSATARAFDHGEVEFLKALTSQAATTIKGLRLYQALEQSQVELRRSEERFRSLVQHASDLVTVIDADTTITYQSPSIEGLLRYQSEEVIGMRLVDLLHMDDAARWLAVLHEAMTDGRGIAVAEARMRHRDGSWRHVEFIGTDQFQNAAIGGFVLNIRDVTERTLLEEQLRHQALHDPLTKLANRTRFGDRLDHALARAARDVRSIAVLFMDLDNFKGVNDSLGHAAGDELLTQVAERVQACLRPGDTVARLGGDEFAILLEDVAAPADATTVTDRIFDALCAPFAISGKALAVRASIGIALGGTEGMAADADALLRAADVAMYVAKSQGKGCSRVFEPSMQASMMQRLELLADLQRALDRDQFVVHYQPMMFLQNGVLSGVEALVRWQHPERGLMPPVEFIGLAEESGVILGLGKWVMQQACRRAADWAARYPSPLSMSVNVSVKQLQSPAFVAEVAQVLRETALEPHLLILEITESVMMQDVPAMVRRLRELKELGVRLAIDDFGTGYSSLSYIRQFPFDLLKIDKSFIDDVGVVPNQRELTKAIIELGKTLNLELVAEGIEHGDQLDRLQTLDCELGQGFYFAKPMDGEAIDALIAALAATAAQAREDAA